MHPSFFLKGALNIFLSTSVLLSMCSCQKTDEEFSPDLSYFPHPNVIQCRPSAFDTLSTEECRSDWGKELRIAYAFTNEQDFYRAITGFKRTLVLLPIKEVARKNQVSFDIVQCYYLAYKYQDAIESFENSCLQNVSKDFPAFKDLLIMLYDSYRQTGNQEGACHIFSIIQHTYPCDAEILRLSRAFVEADFPAIHQASESTPYTEEVSQLLSEYDTVTKSPERAKLYQTLLPGAGYYYVGLKNAALSSFVLNSLFIWAACHFFKEGNIAAGLLITSLETGWYFGGINGAGIAAKEYNERLYEANGREFMRTRSLFPILMLQTTF